ncbi:hypothetical protein H2200_007944 [Cladophialophora chaetospira]|uniref:Uncharacterized protein n=1 Tax=Cladophialophora chaetospira TaxID=386627 RepID=A0AA38X6Q5_9EURO|nr:hypothetical protein H2200_007944 [Cladophialophora chaetospira]
MSSSHHISSTKLFVRFATVITFLYLPTLYFFFDLQPRLSNQPGGGTISNTTLFWIYILTGVLGLHVAGRVLLSGHKLLACLCLRDHATRARYLTELYRLRESYPADMSLTRTMSLDPNYWLFQLLVCFASTGLFEEGIKFLVVAPFLHRSSRINHDLIDVNGQLQRDNAWLSVAIAPGLGFSTLENILYLTSELRQINQGYLVEMAIQRSLYCTTLNVLLVVLSAVNFLSCSV